jgi:hypothetical protein
MRRLATAFLLAFVLLLGQHAATLHALSHAADNLSPQKQLPPPHQCDGCVAGAAFVGAMAPAIVSVAVIAAGIEASPIREATAQLPQRFAFRSRAPPPVS